MATDNNLPQTSQPLVDQNGNLTYPWVNFLANLLGSTGVGGDVQSIALGIVSPFTFKATQAGKLVVELGGGTAAVALSRDGGSTFYTLPGQIFPMRNQDLAQISFTAGATATFWPD